MWSECGFLVSLFFCHCKSPFPSRGGGPGASSSGAGSALLLLPLGGVCLFMSPPNCSPSCLYLRLLTGDFFLARLDICLLWSARAAVAFPGLRAGTGRGLGLSPLRPPRPALLVARPAAPCLCPCCGFPASCCWGVSFGAPLLPGILPGLLLHPCVPFTSTLGPAALGSAKPPGAGSRAAPAPGLPSWSGLVSEGLAGPLASGSKALTLSARALSLWVLSDVNYLLMFF